MADERIFLGRGWGFPFRFNMDTGGILTSADKMDGSSSDEGQKKHLTGSVFQIFRTVEGERFMQPDFGTKVHRLVFESADEILAGLVSYYGTSAIQRWDKRVLLDFVDTVLDGSGKVNTVLRYKIAGTNISGNMVFPFYLKE